MTAPLPWFIAKSDTSITIIDANGAPVGLFPADGRADAQSIIDVVNTDVVVTLRRELAAARAALKEYDDDMMRMVDKLERGTLHVGYCNGNHDARVGDPKYICNCTLGQEIKGLRRQLEYVRQTVLIAYDDGFFAGNAGRGWDPFPGWHTSRAKVRLENEGLSTEMPKEVNDAAR
jgi:hypothetical protein